MQRGLIHLKMTVFWDELTDDTDPKVIFQIVKTPDQLASAKGWFSRSINWVRDKLDRFLGGDPPPREEEKEEEIDLSDAVFSANFIPGNVVNAGSGIYGHSLPNNNALINRNGDAQNTFTIAGVQYTVENFSFEDGGSTLFFEITSESRDIDERNVFSRYSLAIVDENDNTFAGKITSFKDDSGEDWITVDLSSDEGEDPFGYDTPWIDWSSDDSIVVTFHIFPNKETSTIRRWFRNSVDWVRNAINRFLRGGSDKELDLSEAIFSANFAGGTIVDAGDGIHGHKLPSHNALTDDNGDVHHSFTLDGVDYTVYEFSYEDDDNAIFFELKSGSDNVDERDVFEDYSLVIVNEDDETFVERITNFRDGNRVEFVVKTLSTRERLNPFDYSKSWEDWIDDTSTIVEFHIIKTEGVEEEVEVEEVDRDADDDGLIEIKTLAQLNAIRHDSDGDGESTENAYNNVLGSSLDNSGCPDTGCIGYELIADLDFDTNGDGSVGRGDDYYNRGSGWLPIGDGTNTFNTNFYGNGHTISNLRVDRRASRYGGLFGELGADAVVRNLGLESVSVNAKGADQNGPGEHGVGALAGVSRGLIYHTYSTGSVTGEGAQRFVGGLVGRNIGHVLVSYSKASVTGNYDIGGLVGFNDGSVIRTYAIGDVRNNGFDGGGLVGDQSADAIIAYSYSTGDVSPGFPTANSGGLISGGDEGTILQSYFDSDTSNRPSSDSYSKTSSELQSPTSASGIFSDWDKDELIQGIDGWDFGSSLDLPLLSVDFNRDGTASVSEFGNQKIDTTVPIITLNGNDTVALIEGSKYTDAGATVEDPENPDYTGTITTTIQGPSGQTSFDNTVVGGLDVHLQCSG